MVISYILGKMGMKLAEIIRDEANKELYPDESQVKERLVELEMLLESGQLSEEQYEAQEARLIERWREIQENKKEQ